jgi:hypothetical protein
MPIREQLKVSPKYYFSWLQLLGDGKGTCLEIERDRISAAGSRAMKLLAAL